jgi:hypothetical protein
LAKTIRECYDGQQDREIREDCAMPGCDGEDRLNGWKRISTATHTDPVFFSLSHVRTGPQKSPPAEDQNDSKENTVGAQTGKRRVQQVGLNLQS